MVEMFIVQKKLFVLEIDLVFFLNFNMDKNRFPNLVNGTKNELHMYKTVIWMLMVDVIYSM